jgi:hypothetical protein
MHIQPLEAQLSWAHAGAHRRSTVGAALFSSPILALSGAHATPLGDNRRTHCESVLAHPASAFKAPLAADDLQLRAPMKVGARDPPLAACYAYI